MARNKTLIDGEAYTWVRLGESTTRYDVNRAIDRFEDAVVASVADRQP